MKSIGIVGLGNMGMGMATNLVAAGLPVTGYDLSADRVQTLVNRGGKAAHSVAGVGAASDVVFVMVVDAKQASSVLVGEGALLAAM